MEEVAIQDAMLKRNIQDNCETIVKFFVKRNNILIFK